MALDLKQDVQRTAITYGLAVGQEEFAREAGRRSPSVGAALSLLASLPRTTLAVVRSCPQLWELCATDGAPQSKAHDAPPRLSISQRAPHMKQKRLPHRLPAVAAELVAWLQGGTTIPAEARPRSIFRRTFRRIQRRSRIRLIGRRRRGRFHGCWFGLRCHRGRIRVDFW